MGGTSYSPEGVEFNFKIVIFTSTKIKLFSVNLFKLMKLIYFLIVVLNARWFNKEHHNKVNVIEIKLEKVF